MTRPCLALLAALAAAPALGAQGSAPAAPRYRPAAAFTIEALAGTAGALAGFAVVGLSADCGVDDLGCVIRAIGGAGAMGVVGSTVGVSLAARHTWAPRSVGGAALGAVLGTGVGLGVHWLANRNSARNLDHATAIAIFSMGQGIGAAAGSRLLGRR